MADILPFLTSWFSETIAGSPIWAGIGLAAAVLVALFLLYRAMQIVFGVCRSISTSMAARRRRNTQGYGIAVAPMTGSKGNSQTKALIKALEDHLKAFTFGSPVEILKAPRLRAKGAKGLRASAVEWLERSSTDLIVWGHRRKGKSSPLIVDVLSLEGSLSPREAAHSEGFLPMITAANRETTARVSAYLIARTLQPGLGNATAFRAEKLEPVAAVLLECLADKDALPERTQLTLETDYAAMGLHIGGQQHLQNVVEMRRKRLVQADTLRPEIEVQARIDLGRALLIQSNETFDPVKVREAMDHLKIAVDKLKADPVLRLATATNQAVQQGQAMLANRKRFSVTGGSTI